MHYESKQDKFVQQPPPAVYEEPRVSSNPAYGQINIK